jgi:hypothetical protein
LFLVCRLPRSKASFGKRPLRKRMDGSTGTRQRCIAPPPFFLFRPCRKQPSSLLCPPCVFPPLSSSTGITPLEHKSIVGGSAHRLSKQRSTVNVSFSTSPVLPCLPRHSLCSGMAVLRIGLIPPPFPPSLFSSLYSSSPFKDISEFHFNGSGWIQRCFVTYNVHFVWHIILYTCYMTHAVYHIQYAMYYTI